jgi:hypothetical protein
VKTFEIQSGRRSLARRDVHTPQQAVTDYLRTLGCTADEMVLVSPDSMLWRGSIFTATRVADASRSDARDDAGWVTLTLVPNGQFPQPRNGFNVQFFVKACRAGDPGLGGIAGYRLVQVRLAFEAAPLSVSRA